MIPPTRADDDVLRELAERMRNPEQRLADLRAQRAANLTGHPPARRARASATALELLRTATGEILDYAERRTRAALERDARRRELRRGPCSRAATATSALRRARDASAATRSSSTSRARDEQVEGNLNCPLSVTKAACFYAVRVVCDPDAPPSAGAWRPVTVRAPRARCSTRARPRPSSAGTSRPPAGSPTWSSTALAGVRPGRRRRTGHDEQPHARRARTGPTTRRSAAARAPARTPTGRAPSTWRCRTR